MLISYGTETTDLKKFDSTALKPNQTCCVVGVNCCVCGYSFPFFKINFKTLIA